MDPSTLHRLVESAFNEGDVDALLRLYADDARLVRDDNTVAVGAEEIREVWAGFVALGGHISLTTRYAIDARDTALLSNSWTFEGGGLTFSSISAEVATRQGDGSWLYQIDNPFAAEPTTSAS